MDFFHHAKGAKQQHRCQRRPKTQNSSAVVNKRQRRAGSAAGANLNSFVSLIMQVFSVVHFQRELQYTIKEQYTLPPTLQSPFGVWREPYYEGLSPELCGWMGG